MLCLIVLLQLWLTVSGVLMKTERSVLSAMYIRSRSGPHHQDRERSGSHHQDRERSGSHHQDREKRFDYCGTGPCLTQCDGPLSCGSHKWCIYRCCNFICVSKYRNDDDGDEVDGGAVDEVGALAEASGTVGDTMVGAHPDSAGVTNTDTVGGSYSGMVVGVVSGLTKNRTPPPTTVNHVTQRVRDGDSGTDDDDDGDDNDDDDNNDDGHLHHEDDDDDDD